jgi:hypothetical protein
MASFILSLRKDTLVLLKFCKGFIKFFQLTIRKISSTCCVTKVEEGMEGAKHCRRDMTLNDREVYLQSHEFDGPKTNCLTY